uniref:Uncharacterized protein n=1 Tax=Panagrolaimus superbus TaxID=310955 RepID=A0A914XWK3_9BILA
MNSKLFILFVFFAIVSCILAFNIDESADVSDGHEDPNNLIPNLFSRSKRAVRRKCRTNVPGCRQNMCDTCCGKCDGFFCVSFMCLACCG